MATTLFGNGTDPTDIPPGLQDYIQRLQREARRGWTLKDWLMFGGVAGTLAMQFFGAGGRWQAVTSDASSAVHRQEMSDALSANASAAATTFVRKDVLDKTLEPLTNEVARQGKKIEDVQRDVSELLGMTRARQRNGGD